MSEEDTHWWNLGDYTGDDCPNCKRQRLLRCEDTNLKERTVCEKCLWEPARNDYCHEAIDH